jgi:hypothetical protein
MKPRRQNVARTGTQRTKLWPDWAGITATPFPLHAFSASGEGAHDLGKILTPAQMAANVPAGASPPRLGNAARAALDALIGCGPTQVQPHMDTALLLAEGLARLRDYALAGDAAAMNWLGFLLHTNVADLAEIARRRPEIVREWSRMQNVVPVLTGKNVGHRKQLTRDLDAFGVGESSVFRVNPPRGKKAPDVSLAANGIAGQLCQHLNWHKAVFDVLEKPVPEWARMASRLPPLSKAVWERWADAAWECALDATAGKPEESPVLRPLGAKAARKDGLQTPATLASNIRAEIRQTLREAFCNLASVSPPTNSE